LFDSIVIPFNKRSENLEQSFDDIDKCVLTRKTNND
jgi:hypothetical protein